MQVLAFCLIIYFLLEKFVYSIVIIGISIITLQSSSIFRYFFKNLLKVVRSRLIFYSFGLQSNELPKSIPIFNCLIPLLSILIMNNSQLSFAVKLVDVEYIMLLPSGDQESWRSTESLSVILLIFEPSLSIM